MSAIPTTPSYLNRDIRQRDIVPPQKLARCHALVIGVGAIGRQVALQLAAAGLAKMELIDDDAVAVENLAPQAYWVQDLALPKVEATARACRLLNPEIDLSARRDRFRRASPKELATFADQRAWPIVFCCVDSIECRRLVAAPSRNSRAERFCLGRLSRERR